MIAKGKSISHTTAALNYGRLERKEAEEIGRRFLGGESAQEIAQEFRMCQDLNQHCKKNTLQFVVSPSIEDGKQLSKEDLQNIYNDFLKRMNLDDRQSIAYVHRNRKHTHMHIYVNRIGFDGEAYKDNFLSNRASKTAEEIAISRNMTTARQIETLKLDSKKDLIAYIKNAHETAIKHHKPRDLEDYIDLMKASKVNVEIVRSQYTNEISGLRMEFGGESIKASKIDRSMSYGNLMKQFAPSIAENLNIGLKTANKVIKTIDKGLGLDQGIPM